MFKFLTGIFYCKILLMSVLIKFFLKLIFLHMDKIDQLTIFNPYQRLFHGWQINHGFERKIFACDMEFSIMQMCDLLNQP